MTIGNKSAELLQSYADRLTRLDEEIQAAIEEHVTPLRSDLKDLYAEAASNGFDRKALKEALRRLRLDDDLRSEVETYEAVLLKELLS